jgi:hypothetical protein
LKSIKKIKTYYKNLLDKDTTKVDVKNIPRNDSKLTAIFIQFSGVISPYPTVVKVIIVKYRAFPNLLIRKCISKLEF